jgi:signal transduction histidine kinase/ActR/RegA family two-component response regulator
MAVQILLVDAHREGDALERQLRERASVTRARSLEGAVELLRWFDHRVVVVCFDHDRLRSPPDGWSVETAPPIVTCGTDAHGRNRWRRLARQHVTTRAQLAASSNDLLGATSRLVDTANGAKPAPLAFAAGCGSEVVQDIIDGANDGCILVRADHTVQYATPAARELLEGWGSVEVGRRLPSELRIAEHEIVTTHAKRSIELKVASGGAGACRAIWVRDVTEQVRSGDLERRLLHSDRLAAMGQLAAGVAHEVNNPAAFVTANLCMMSEYVQQLDRALGELERRAEADSRLDRHLGAVKDAFQVGDAVRDLSDIIKENLDGMGRISTIVRDLRNFSRIEDSHVEPVHPNEIVNSACSLAHNQIRHRARLVKELGEVSAITGDRNKLVQVLMNLLMNAAQATPDGDASDHFVRVATEEREGRVHISVTDNGSGIPEDVRSRIFEPFFTTKSRDRGTGLGLALCADIVRQHGGDIEVRSEEGEGSCFIVRLPLESNLKAGPAQVETADLPSPQLVDAPDDRAPELKTAPGASEPAPTRDRRILLVDDEIMLLRAFGRALSKRHQVEMVSSGEEALDRLKAGERWDVIVCDLMMPGVDGVRVYEALDQVAPDMKSRIMFCSGGAFTPRTREFCARVTVPILDKPLRVADLEVAIGQTLERAHREPDPFAPSLALRSL